jgi:hypothetical protein
LIALGLVLPKEAAGNMAGIVASAETKTLEDKHAQVGTRKTHTGLVSIRDVGIVEGIVDMLIDWGLSPSTYICSFFLLRLESIRILVNVLTGSGRRWSESFGAGRPMGLTCRDVRLTCCFAITPVSLLHIWCNP